VTVGDRLLDAVLSVADVGELVGVLERSGELFAGGGVFA
jgi:hypothetical protein